MIEEADRNAGPVPEPAGKKSALGELLESVIIAVVLAAVIRLFILAPFYIPSGSMEPTLLVNDRIIVSKLAYHLGEPHRGDIVVFKYPLDPSRDFVKRLIAVGGETVELRNSHLYINGREMPENYLPPGMTFANFGPKKVPKGSYFMLGDNRNNSDDSRVWGPLPRQDIIGKAIMIYWPLDRIGLLKR
ncbi:signal peptidase I [Desulfotomaculum copahuensis]|uniref:Signal peptidase I n=1 Tax=Desulfotomaculum copahuensis TaxID=1838280 RepID=A0A1B7LAZ5_9FIRM|nr:signal peptidase I [Desulfotomaculum copahuensis]OAT79512.1 signal peptidase I [Desulfotomaculum copahuensis]